MGAHSSSDRELIKVIWCNRTSSELACIEQLFRMDVGHTLIRPHPENHLEGPPSLFYRLKLLTY